MDSTSFQHIATALRPRLLSLCQRFFSRQEVACEAEDAVQETLLRLWLMRDRLGEYRSPESLATMIAKNVCIDMWRLSRAHHDSLDETLSVPACEQADHSAIANDVQRMISQAMLRLPATQRRMLVMRGEGMTMTEIAAACAVTPASAKTMICNARRLLMLLLKIRRDKR